MDLNTRKLFDDFGNLLPLEQRICAGLEPIIQRTAKELVKRHGQSYVDGLYRNHEIPLPEDDGGPITFDWHWPKGTFSKRMSALELSEFVMKHMPAILPLLSDRPRIQAHWAELLRRMATWTPAQLDQLHTWIKPIVGREEDDVLQLCLSCDEPQPVGKMYSLGGVA